MVYKYAFQGYDIDKMARGVGISLKGVSRKDAMMIANFIKGREVVKVIRDLEEVVKLRKAIPFTKFCNGIGHRKGKVGPKVATACRWYGSLHDARFRYSDSA